MVVALSLKEASRRLRPVFMFRRQNRETMRSYRIRSIQPGQSSAIPAEQRWGTVLCVYGPSRGGFTPSLSVCRSAHAAYVHGGKGSGGTFS